jgi:hypothetical protein
MAVEIGARSRSEQKRRALGAIIGRAFVDPTDSAIVDETELMLKTVEALEVPHIRVLVRVLAGNMDHTSGVDPEGVLDIEINKVLPSGPAQTSVLATLKP